MVLKGLDIEDRDAEELGGVTRPDEPAERYKRHHIATVSPARVIRFTPVDPGFEDRRDRMKEALDALLNLRCEGSGNHRR
jgi:hypothetical protein